MNFPCSVIYSFFHLFQLFMNINPEKGNKQQSTGRKKKQTVKPKVLKLINNLSDFVQ